MPEDCTAGRIIIIDEPEIRTLYDYKGHAIDAEIVKPEDKLPADIKALWDLEYKEATDRGFTQDPSPDPSASAWRAIKELYEQTQSGEWRPKTMRKESPTMLQDLERRLEITGLHLLAEPAAIILYESEGENGEQLTEMMCAHSGTYYLNGPDEDPVVYDTDFFNKMVSAFEMRLRDQDIPVDYDHRMEKAAGWIKRLYTKDGDLWASIKWTPKGKQKIMDGEYRYPSIAYCDKYRNPRTGMMGENVLISLAVTNYPALKGTAPITAFSEKDSIAATDERHENNEETQEQIERKEIEDMAMTEEKKPLEVVEAPAVDASIDGFEKLRSEYGMATEKLAAMQAEKDALFAELQERKEAEAKALAEKEAFERKTGYTARMESLTLKNPDRAKTGEAVLRAEQVEEAVNFLMDLSPDQAETAVKLFSEMPAMVVPLGEVGTGAGGEEPEMVQMSDDEKARKAMENAQARSEWADPEKRYAVLKEEESKMGIR